MKKFLLFLLFPFLLIGCGKLEDVGDRTWVVDGEDLTPVFNITNNAELAFVSPAENAEDIGGKTPVTILWDKPVFGLQNPEKTQKFLNKNIVIEPDIEGSWQLVGTTGVLFEPREDWKPSNTYTFRLADKGFGKESEQSFFTSRVSIDSVSSNNLVGDKPLVLRFNQEVDLDITKKIKFSPTLSHTARYVEDEGVEEDDSNVSKKDLTRVEIVPKSGWQENTSYEFILPTGTHGKHGPLERTSDQVMSFQTAGPFVAETECDDLVPKDVFQNLNIRFSAPVKVSDFIKYVRLSGVIEEHWEEHLSSLFEGYEDDYRWNFWIPPVDGNWQANKQYELTFSSALSDEYGRRLSQQKSCAFSAVFPDRVERTFFPYEERVFQKGTVPVFSVWYSGQITSPTVRLTKLLPERETSFVNLSWTPSYDTRTVVDLDPSKLFPELLVNGVLPSGWYEIELDWAGGYRFVSKFAVSDFPVEIQKFANDTFEVFPRSFGTQPEHDKFGLQIFEGSYDSSVGRNVYIEKYSFDKIERPYDVVVLMYSGDEIGIGSTNFDRGITPYSANLNYSPYAYNRKLSAVAFTDRPLFKPGDRMHFKSIFREKVLFDRAFPLAGVNAWKRFNYTVSIYDPLGNEVLNTTQSTTGGSLDGYWDIPADSTLGSYSMTINFSDQESSTTTSFYVTEYRKPNFLVSSKFDQDMAILADTMTAKISGNYAFGGALSGKDVNYSVTLFGYEDISPWGWYWYYPTKRDKVIVQGQGKLGPDGSIEIPVNLDVDLEEGISWNTLTLSATVSTSPAESSSATVSVPFYHSERDIELGRNSYFFKVGDAISSTGKLQDLQGKAVKGKVTATMFEKKWVRNDRKASDGVFEGEWKEVEERVASQSIDTNDRGEFTNSFDSPDASGEYVIRFSSPDSKGRQAEAEHHFWVWGDTGRSLQIREDNTDKILPLYLDKDEYKIGEKVTILFPHSEWKIDRVHATIDRGSVLQKLEADITNQMVSFELTSWMAPNVYVSVLIEGRDENGSSQIRWGAINVPVNDPSKALDISLEPKQKVYKPGDTALIDLRTQVSGNGKAAEVTIAVVDQTLLAVKARDALDLWKKFLAELPYGVQRYHSTANLLSEKDLDDIYAEVEEIREKADMGIGDGKGDEEGKPRGDFRDTALFVASIQTDENGYAQVEVPLPDNLTTWNVWAVGHTNDNAFGEGESSFQSTLPLLVSPLMPNIFRAGDETNLGVLVRRNGEEKEEEVEVTFRIPDLFTSSKDLTQKITLTDEKRVYLPISIAYDQESFPLEGEEVEITVSVKSKTGSDSFVISRKVLAPHVSVSVAEFLDVSEMLQVPVVADKRSLDSQIVLGVYGSLFNRMNLYVDVAKERNYGCSEQQFTDWTTRMAYKELSEVSGQEVQDINVEELRESRDDILATQNSDGGFKFWRGSRYPSLWLTTHIVDHMDMWKTYGAAFSSETKALALDWMRKHAFLACDGFWYCPDNTTRTYAAYVLAKNGRINVGDLEYFSELTTSSEARIWWMRAYDILTQSASASPGMVAHAEELVEKIKQGYVTRDRYSFWEEGESSFYSQNERLTAITLGWLLDNDILSSQHSDIARYLSDSRSQDLSGNSALHVLTNLADYEKQRSAEVSYPISYNVSVKGDEVLSGKLEGIQNRSSETVSVKPGKQVAIKLEGDSSYYADIELREVLSASDISPVTKGFWIERQMYEFDDEEFATPVRNLVAGKSYRVRMKIVTNTAHRQVIVEDPLPSGVEAVNFDLDNVPPEPSEEEVGIARCWGWCQPLVSHEEFYFDKARFFIDYLDAGTHEITYVINARIPGEYEHLPAKVMEMYYPEVFALGYGKTLKIEAPK